MRRLSIAIAALCACGIMSIWQEPAVAAAGIADLAASIDGPLSSSTDQVLTYTLNIHNAGPDAALAVDMTSWFQTGANPAFQNITSASGSCSAVKQTEGTSATCLFASIAPGASVSATLSVTVTGQNLAIVGFVASTASNDPNRTNDTASLVVNRSSSGSGQATVIPRAQVATKNLPVGYPGEQYRVRLEITGGSPPYTTLLDPRGTYAPGLSLTPDGWILGAPTATGSYTLAVTVSDVNDARRSPVRFTTATLSLVVLERPPLEVIRRLPRLVTGLSLDVPLVSGGTPPYGIRAARGSLPPGWRLDASARLSGVAEVSGPYRVPLTIMDARGRTASGTLSGVVYAQPGFATRPNPLVTRGTTNPLVTPRTLGRTVCSKGWLATQTVGLTAPMQRSVLLRYGLPPSTRAYVFSTLLPVELGGSANELQNIWPQLRSSAGRTKKLAAALNARLCAGAATLAAVRREFRDSLSHAR
jgi:hypothetical protein